MASKNQNTRRINNTSFSIEDLRAATRMVIDNISCLFLVSDEPLVVARCLARVSNGQAGSVMYQEVSS